MRLAGAAWSFVGATLTESASIWRSLDVHAMDLLVEPGSPLAPELVEKNPAEFAARFREPEMDLVNLILVLGEDFHERPNNTSDQAVWSQNLDSFKRVFDCCAQAEVKSITVTPGVDLPGLTHEDSLALVAERLLEFTALGREANVGVVFEPHVESVLESPHHALEFLEKHVELRIVLDYSHFVAVGYSPAEVDPLVPFADHVHLRQAANKQLQARWEDGIIDFVSVVELLRQAEYDGFLAFEYEHAPWMQMDQCDVMTETIKMRGLVRPLL